MLRSIGKQSGKSAESVLMSAVHLSKNWFQFHDENGISCTVSRSVHLSLHRVHVCVHKTDRQTHRRLN